MQAPKNLPELVRSTFLAATRSQVVTHYPTQVALVSVKGISFQLRYSEALRHKNADKSKPQNDDDANQPPKKPFNPFENPPETMTIPSPDLPLHRLVLNKFAIVPEHFLLVTREFKHQTRLLEEEDLEAAWACIQAYKNSPDGELFAFFNSGTHSGASQPHRHIQLLPIARMREDLPGEEGEKWEVLADKLLDRDTLVPFVTHAESLEQESITGKTLHDTYTRLYSKMCKAAQVELTGEDGHASVSYNMAITKNAMVLCQRTTEDAPVKDKDGNTIGTLGLNGTLLAGTALAKGLDEWKCLRDDPEQLEGILAQVGVPRKNLE